MLSTAPSTASSFPAFFRAFRLATALGVAIAAGAFAAPAFAQAPAPASPDGARADQLFKRARELMSQGDHASACPMLEESQRLDPSAGTLLNLGDCYEKAERFATAVRVYRELVPEARRLGQRDRETYASERIAALEPKLSKLRIEFSAASSVPELRVELDGKALEAAALGGAIPVDGGSHRVGVSAPGHEPWSTEITLAKQGDTRSVAVPALRRTSAEAAPAPAAVTPAPPPALPEPARESGERPVSPVIYAVGAGSLALGVAGGVVGGLALRKSGRFEEANQNPERTRAEREDLRDSASSLALVSTVLTGAALAGAGVTIYLYVTRPSRSEAATQARRPSRLAVSPWLSGESAGLSVAGSL